MSKDNVRFGVIVARHKENPLLFDVRMPAGDENRAFIRGKAPIVLGGPTFNKIIGPGEG